MIDLPKMVHPALSNLLILILAAACRRDARHSVQASQPLVLQLICYENPN